MSSALRAVLTPPRRTLSRRLARLATRAAAWAMIVVGAPFALLPGHLGAPLVFLGLILLLRSSYGARRAFVGLQRRHPRLVFPLRRLLRRRPEVAPVFWQLLLRSERLLLPRRWRAFRRLRRRLRGRRVRAGIV